MYRDFSERNKAHLLELVTQVENEKLCNFTDWIGDRWYDLEDWIGILNIRNYINNVNIYHKKVIDKNNTTKSTIELIFGKVRTVDNQYNINFKNKHSQLNLWKEYIEELSGIVNPSNGSFKSEYISSSMEKKLEEYMNYINSWEGVMNEKYPELIGFDPTKLVLDSRNTAVDALALGWTGDWIKNFISLIGGGVLGVQSKNNNFKHFLNSLTDGNVNDVYMRKSIESVIQELLVNKHELTDFYDDYTDALMPEELELEKKIISNFVKTGKIYTETELANLLQMDISEFKNSEILKWLNQGILQEDNLKFLNNMSDKIKTTIGAYGDAVEILDISADMLTKIFNDYTEDTKYLEAIKRALTDGGYDNKTVNRVVDSMLWEYRNKYASAVSDGIEKVAGEVINEGIDKALPLLKVFIDTKNISSSVIGLKDTTDNIADVYATQQYSYALVEKYEFYRQKINSGIYTKDDVEQCDLFFKLAKQAKLQEYKGIKVTLEKALNSAGAIFSSSEDKQYTRDVVTRIVAEIEKLENM